MRSELKVDMLDSAMFSNILNFCPEISNRECDRTRVYYCRVKIGCMSELSLGDSGFGDMTTCGPDEKNGKCVKQGSGVSHYAYSENV